MRNEYGELKPFLLLMWALPKNTTQAVGATEYFDVEIRAGQIILTPVRSHRGDAVRAKLADLGLEAFARLYLDV